MREVLAEPRRRTPARTIAGHRDRARPSVTRKQPGFWVAGRDYPLHSKRSPSAGAHDRDTAARYLSPPRRADLGPGPRAAPAVEFSHETKVGMGCGREPRRRLLGRGLGRAFGARRWARTGTRPRRAWAPMPLAGAA
jgi:hypothetical protein